MKKSRFTEAHIMGVLREAEDGMPMPELCREHGINNASPQTARPYLRAPRQAAARLWSRPQGGRDPRRQS